MLSSMCSTARHACATKLLHCGECRRMTAASPDAPDTPTLCAHMRAATLPLLRTSQARITYQNCQVSIRQSLPVKSKVVAVLEALSSFTRARAHADGHDLRRGVSMSVSFCSLLTLCNALFRHGACARRRYHICTEKVHFCIPLLPVLSTTCTGRLDCSAHIPCYACRA